MSKKQEDKANKESTQNEDDIPKPQSTKLTKDNEKQDENNENERSLEDIEKELDKLRPKPPSPKTQHRIEKEEEKKDHEMNMHQTHKEEPSPQPNTTNNDENETQHKDTELKPGEPDPTVNDNVKIPVLNDSGTIELKPQQGTKLNKH
ncbi:unnamed protein product [Rotaria sp. Silwood1]|nr:unnamed protein product [Rotaria sp. Silwood1]CAF3398203.1 unnamed protein product [Rotaria sp. Silwood1]CAF3413162.1 unnamed protein product [Rotaria sp. Silwood1]CAF4542978.1 unnamed protein product [Rotaria sp. Silwood1]CAF4605175.1 unnamed protein product [Rotaria sp. Silwood1]